VRRSAIRVSAGFRRLPALPTGRERRPVQAQNLIGLSLGPPSLRGFLRLANLPNATVLKVMRALGLKLKVAV
jgi:hypothetical protein